MSSPTSGSRGLGVQLWISARIRVQSSSRNEDRDAIASAATWSRFSVYRWADPCVSLCTMPASVSAVRTVDTCRWERTHHSWAEIKD